MSELIDRQGVIDRLKKAEDVFRQNGAKLEANGIHYALELVESDIEIPTIEPRKERPHGNMNCMDEDAKQASIPYTYNAPKHDWKCGYPDIIGEEE